MILFDPPVKHAIINISEGKTFWNADHKAERQLLESKYSTCFMMSRFALNPAVSWHLRRNANLQPLSQRWLLYLLNASRLCDACFYLCSFMVNTFTPLPSAHEHVQSRFICLRHSNNNDVSHFSMAIYQPEVLTNQAGKVFPITIHPNTDNDFWNCCSFLVSYTRVPLFSLRQNKTLICVYQEE